MGDAAWQVKFSAYKTAAETQIAALRAEVRALRGFAQDCERGSRLNDGLIDDWMDPIEVRADMKRHGLIDINGEPTPLLTGEPRPGGSDD